MLTRLTVFFIADKPTILHIVLGSALPDVERQTGHKKYHSVYDCDDYG